METLLFAYIFHTYPCKYITYTQTQNIVVNFPLNRPNGSYITLRESLYYTTMNIYLYFVCGWRCEKSIIHIMIFLNALINTLIQAYRPEKKINKFFKMLFYVHTYTSSNVEGLLEIYSSILLFYRSILK